MDVLERIIKNRRGMAGIVLLAFSGFIGASAHGAPAIMSPAPVYDFGQVDNGEKIEHNFIIKNVGDEPLLINDVKVTCGCTVAKLDVRSLEPGMETVITASLSLKGKQGMQNKRITVTSNDPESPNYFLEFTGEALATISIEPNLLHLGQIMDNEPHAGSVVVKSTREGHTFKIEKLEVPEPSAFTASYEEIVPGKEYRVTATTMANPMAGMMNGRMIITTDDPDRPLLNISVYGNVIGELQVKPEVVTIRGNSAPDAQPATQYLQVISGRIQDFELLEIIAPVEGMTAELIKRKDNDYHIKLTNMPVDNSLNNKELIVTTNLPEKPEIRIPIRVLPSRPVQVGKTPSRVPVARPAVRPSPAAPASSN